MKKILVSNPKKVLIVIAHPDDEGIGAGGTLSLMFKKGYTISVCLLSSMARQRSIRQSDNELMDDFEQSCKVLGIDKKYISDFPNIRMNTVPHSDIVKCIEDAILNSKPNLIFTHYMHDLNIDHRIVSDATLVASRVFQRKCIKSPIESIFLYEILSSTDWSHSSSKKFNPDTYVDISDTIEDKIKSIECYKNVLRDAPHPRSKESIKSLSVLRGSESGLFNAEAFETVFSVFKP
jgi:N-acetylglucosamine malate deacetylase 1